ncbi:hypothetical protein Tco_1347874 [Tanacetum coccineum]
MISFTNIRLETIVPQKEETFKVVIDLIKNSTCFKAFTLSVDKCVVDADVFKKILDICLRVKGVDFTDVPNDDTALTFLIRLGYKGPLYKHTNILKFVRIGEDYQEYRLHIPDVMLTDAIKQSESYQIKKTSSKRRVKKKVTLYADDNIIFDDPDAALELAKSIIKTEAEEAEAARQVYATHARIVTESVSEPTRRRKSSKFGRRQPGTGGSNEGTTTIPGVSDDSIVISATSSEGTESEHSEEDQLDKEKDDKDSGANDEGDDHISDTQDADDEDVKTESDEDKIYKYKIRVRKDEDVEMENAEVKESNKGDEDVTNAAKEDAKKTSEVKDDTKKNELPPTSSSLSVSSGFGDQFLKLSSDSSLVSTVKDSTDADLSSLMDIPIQQETPYT